MAGTRAGDPRVRMVNDGGYDGLVIEDYQVTNQWVKKMVMLVVLVKDSGVQTLQFPGLLFPGRPGSRVERLSLFPELAVPKALS